MNAALSYFANRPLRIATRESQLALWQANYVKAKLEQTFSGLAVELVKMTTQGDQLLDSPLAKIGGKGLFIKELEVAMVEERADIAVHSMKDVPAQMPEGFALAAILERETPYDALVSANFASVDGLPEGARVGTCSLRRSAQLRAYRPDVQILDLRGNVNTRLAKLDGGEFDAIILAHAGLRRLGMESRVRQVLPDTMSLPAVGQGAVGIETVEGAPAQLISAALADPQTDARVRAERAMNHALEGGCQVPIAGFAELDERVEQPLSQRQLRLRGLVASVDGETVLRASADGAADAPEVIGKSVAEQLLSQGAKAILDAIKANS